MWAVMWLVLLICALVIFHVEVEQKGYDFFRIDIVLSIKFG